MLIDIRVLVDALYRDGLSESHVIHVQNSFRALPKQLYRVALESHQNTPEVHIMYLQIGPYLERFIREFSHT